MLFELNFLLGMNINNVFSEVEPDDGKEILVEDDQNLELTAG